MTYVLGTKLLPILLILTKLLNPGPHGKLFQDSERGSMT